MPDHREIAIKLRTAVQHFAEAMELKLRAHDSDKGDSWMDMDVSEIMDRIDDEVAELDVVAADGHDEYIAAEAVDVANFCMFAWAKVSKGRHYA